MYEFRGSKDNNNIQEGVLGRPLLDPNPAVDPSERYKATTYQRLSPSSHGISLWVSEDGIQWRKWQQEPLFTSSLPNAFDGNQNRSSGGSRSDSTSASSDTCLGEFGPSSRPPPRICETGRSRSLQPSATLPWKTSTSALPTPISGAPHILLGVPKRLVPRRKYHTDVPHVGISDGIFMSSRDGVHWNRFMEAFIRPGRDERNWIHRTTFTVPGEILTAPDKISLYVSRNYTYPSAHLERMTLRIDGFVSINGGYAGGEFVTKPLVFQGENLVLNFATSAAGSIRVEIQDAQGNPLPGFALEESPLIWGDEIEHTVRWERTHGKATSDNPLARIEGKPVRLRFVMKDADLYSLRFR